MSGGRALIMSGGKGIFDEEELLNTVCTIEKELKICTYWGLEQI